jgi:hypothetical protein
MYVMVVPFGSIFYVGEIIVTADGFVKGGREKPVSWIVWGDPAKGV